MTRLSIDQKQSLLHKNVEDERAQLEAMRNLSVPERDEEKKSEDETEVDDLETNKHSTDNSTSSTLETGMSQVMESNLLTTIIIIIIITACKSILHLLLALQVLKYNSLNILCS